MESERIELMRIAGDAAATARLVKIRNFKATPEVRQTYETLIKQYATKGDTNKFSLQRAELQFIAKQEQINVLQPLIYDDPHLTETMDLNHWVSRFTGGWLSPQFKVVYSAGPTTDDPKLETVFDPPTGLWNQMTGVRKSLPNQDDRMKFVRDIADDFNGLMTTERAYMEGELRKIRGWLNA